MNISIDFDETVEWREACKTRLIQFKGRNGYVHCTGINVQKGLSDESIRINAINSKGECGTSCWLEVPEEYRLKVCLAILPELKELLKAIPDDRLPDLIGTSLESLIEMRAKE